MVIQQLHSLISELKLSLSFCTYLFIYLSIICSFLLCVSLLKWGSLFGGPVQALSSWQTKLLVNFISSFFLFYFIFLFVLNFVIVKAF